ncbi:MAG: hypothetical protein M5U32_03640 [Myxococcota bacterium]|nr:hypothetical protein [Myxococcota bacterium]
MQHLRTGRQARDDTDESVGRSAREPVGQWIETGSKHGEQRLRIAAAGPVVTRRIDREDQERRCGRGIDLQPYRPYAAGQAGSGLRPLAKEAHDAVPVG